MDGPFGEERREQRPDHRPVGARALLLPAHPEADALEGGAQLRERHQPHGVGVGHPLPLPSGQRFALLHGEGEAATHAQGRGDSAEQRLLVREREQGLQQQDDVERPRRHRRHMCHLEAARKSVGAVPGQLDRARARVHTEVGAAQLRGDVASRPRHAAAQVEDGDPRPDAGPPRQRQDLAGPHEALLAHELAGRVRRHTRPLQRPVEGRALVLLHRTRSGSEPGSSTCPGAVRSPADPGRRRVHSQSTSRPKDSASSSRATRSAAVMTRGATTSAAATVSTTPWTPAVTLRQ